MFPILQKVRSDFCSDFCSDLFVMVSTVKKSETKIGNQLGGKLGSKIGNKIGDNYVAKHVMATLSCLQRSDDLVPTSVSSKRIHVRAAAMKKAATSLATVCDRSQSATHVPILQFRGAT